MRDTETTLPYEILMRVSKPARYTGGEINMVQKNTDVPVRFCFCFPDLYEIGMSHLGLQIIYFMLNGREDTYCERAFTPWTDMENILRESRKPLFSLETFTPLADFDILGFTLQYEMSYTNILTMLELSFIPFYSRDRGEEHPVICAGGPCAYNPEPLAELVDFFYIGEAEEQLPFIIDIYKENKENGGSKADFLEKLLEIDGVYVPKYYDVNYNSDGTIESFKSNHDRARNIIKKNIRPSLAGMYFPDRQLVPLIETVHDRVAVEVFRGCIRGCRFCQAGYIYRPMREKAADELIHQACNLISATGHDEISLVSLSTGDYSEFGRLSQELLGRFADKKVNIALPSLRIDAFNLDIMSKAQAVRKSSLTFAPEAGTQRLRDVINKNITRDEILAGTKLAFMGGWNRIKLYFMVGLPTETREDLEGIMFLSEDIVSKYYELPKEHRNGGVSVSVSASCFVPKPFTPFQWEPQDSSSALDEKCRFVKKSFKRKQVRFNYHEAKLSVLEGVFARGDRKTAELLIRAYKHGARFDSWTDCFKPEAWDTSFEETGLSLEFYSCRRREFDEILPWDFIDIGVTKDFLISEAKKALVNTVTPDCRTACAVCGANSMCPEGGVCRER